MVDIVKDVVSFEFLLGNSLHTYRRYIKMIMILLQRRNITNIIENIDGEETGLRKRNISHLDNQIFFHVLEGERTVSDRCRKLVHQEPDE